MTAATPRACSALLASIETISACACGERRIAACNVPRLDRQIVDEARAPSQQCRVLQPQYRLCRPVVLDCGICRHSTFLSLTHSRGAVLPLSDTAPENSAIASMRQSQRYSALALSASTEKESCSADVVPDHDCRQPGNDGLGDGSGRRNWSGARSTRAELGEHPRRIWPATTNQQWLSRRGTG